MTATLVDYLHGRGYTHGHINAISSILLKAGARDPVIVWKCLDATKIQLNSDGTVLGVEEQVEALQERAPYMFESPATPAEPEVCTDADAFYTLMNFGGEWSQLGLYVPLNVRTPVPKRVAFQTAQAHVNKKVVDSFQQQNWFFRNLPIQEITNAVDGGDAAVYRYHREANLPSVNSEVTETYTETLTEEATIANLATTFNMDVDQIRLGGAVDMFNQHLYYAAQGISNLFNEMVIRGDSAVPKNPKDPAVGPASLDGLDKIIRRDSLHVWDETLNLTGLEHYPMEMDRKNVNTLCTDVDHQMMSRLCELQPNPTFILGNDDLILALSALGRQMGTYQMTTNNLGQSIASIGGIALVSMDRHGKAIIPTEKAKVDDISEGIEKLCGNYGGFVYRTKAYVGSFGPNAVQGLTLPGNLVEVRPPGNINIGNWVKKWRVGMHIGLAVMSRHACGMFTNIYLPKWLFER